MGSSNISNGADFSFAIGQSRTFGNHAVAMGKAASNGAYYVSIGQQTNASSDNSVALSSALIHQAYI